VLAWNYDRIGNPLSLPVNAWMAWRCGVPIGSVDRLLGNFILDKGADDGLPTPGRIEAGAHDEFFVSGWADESVAVDGRVCRPVKGGRGRLAFELFYRRGRRVSVELARLGAAPVDVRLRFNGALVAQGRLDQPRLTLAADLDPAMVKRSINVLDVEKDGAAPLGVFSVTLSPGLPVNE